MKRQVLQNKRAGDIRMTFGTFKKRGPWPVGSTNAQMERVKAIAAYDQTVHL